MNYQTSSHVHTHETAHSTEGFCSTPDDVCSVPSFTSAPVNSTPGFFMHTTSNQGSPTPMKTYNDHHPYTPLASAITASYPKANITITQNPQLGLCQALSRDESRTRKRKQEPRSTEKRQRSAVSKLSKRTGVPEGSLQVIDFLCRDQYSSSTTKRRRTESQKKNKKDVENKGGACLLCHLVKKKVRLRQNPKSSLSMGFG